MKSIFFLTVLVIYAQAIHLEETVSMPGGVYNSQVVPEIDQFIRAQYPKLGSAKLTNTRSQVVAGILYLYTYEKDNKQWTITVWDRDWLHDRHVTSITKVEQKLNEAGQRVRVTTTTRIQNQNFTQLVKNSL